MFGPRLFSRRPAVQPNPREVSADRAATRPAISPADGYERSLGGAAKPETTKLKKEPSGSWMGSLVGGLGRLQKAAAGAVLGAVALTTISSGAALGAEMPEPSLVPDHVIEQQVQNTTYTVKSGDSMWSIAKRNGVPFAALIAANPQIKDPGLIFPKQVLTLPTQDVPRPIVRPSAAENAPAPAAVSAQPISAPAPAPVDSAQSAAPTKPGSLGKLWREVRKLTFDLLKDQKIDQDEQFELGEFTTLGLSLKGIFKDSAAGNWDRMAFERAQDKTKDVLWLDTQGAISAA